VQETPAFLDSPPIYAPAALACMLQPVEPQKASTPYSPAASIPGSFSCFLDGCVDATLSALQANWGEKSTSRLTASTAALAYTRDAFSHRSGPWKKKIPVALGLWAVKVTRSDGNISYSRAGEGSKRTSDYGVFGGK